MYTIDTTTFPHFIGSFLGLVWGALTLNPDAFRSVPNTTGANMLTLTILFLAGVSEMLGQSVVLLANKVTRRRFVNSLALSGAIFIFGAIVSMSSVWLIGTLAFHADRPVIDVIRQVSLGYAPLLLSFFILLPYMGTFVGHGLEIWSLLAILLAVQVALHLHLWQAVICALVGWAIIRAVKYFLGRPTLALQRRQGGTGSLSLLRTHDLITALNEEIANRPPEEPR